jgi:hypothetical protein
MEKKNFKSKALVPAIIVLGVILVSGISIATASNKQVSSLREVADSLTAKLRQAIKDAESSGEFTTDELGNKVYAGETAKKMQQLHEEATKAHMALLERPVNQRQGAISRIQELISDKSIRSFVGDLSSGIAYTSTGKSSYNSEAIVEFYKVGRDYVEVDIRNNEIIQFGPAPTRPGEEGKKFDKTAKYSVADLQVMANEFIAKNTKMTDLAAFKASVGNKEETNYFFRWENLNKKLEDGRPAFVQVGFTIGGELLSYTNSLGI